MKQAYQDFNYSDWTPYWSGDWPPLSFSSWGFLYIKTPFTTGINRFVERKAVIWESQKSTCFLRESEKENFAKVVVKKIEKNEKVVEQICSDLKSKADAFLKFTEEYINGDVSLQQFQRYQKLLLNYYPSHIQVKVSVDYLPKELLEKHFSKFQEARVYSEPVFSRSVEFVKNLSKIYSEKTGYAPEFIRAMLGEEFEDYLEKNRLPTREILSKRVEGSAYLFFNNKLEIATGKEFMQIKNILTTVKKQELKGACAYPGRVTGLVRIVADPSKPGDFRQGDILVAGMTRPEYLPLMKKAGAIVTDAGGLLCHAAIVARELKVPCVIGTKNATLMLRNGEKVEIDAEKGTVKQA